MAHKPKKDHWARSFTVTEPTLHPNGYTVYKVTMLAFSTHTPDETTEVSLWKRYSDFKTLHKVLSALHRNLHRPGAFPDFAEPVVFGRFNAEVIEVRRRSALAMLQFITTQSHLYNSPAFQQFMKISESAPSAVFQNGQSTGVLSPRCGECPAVESRQPLPAQIGIAVAPSPVPPLPSGGGPAVSSSAVPPFGAGLLSSSANQSTASAPLIEPQRLTNDPLAAVAATAATSTVSSFADESASAPAASQFDLSRAFFRTNRDLSMFDPLCGDTDSGVYATVDEIKPSEDSSAPAADLEAEVADLAAWADVDSSSSRVPKAATMSPALSLPEVPALAGEPDFFVDHLPDVPAERPNSAVARGRSRRSLSPPPPAPPPDLASDTVADTCTESSDYVTDAAAQALQGERYFAVGKHEVSLKHYECAVTLLIRGVQDDTDEKRRALAAERTQQYLAQAQRVAKGFLHHQESSRADAPSLRLGAVSFDASPPLRTARAMFDFGCTAGADSELLGPVDQLSNYKVLGVVDKVMLVLDKSTERTYVMKVLQKNEPTDVARRNGERHVIPSRCPNMVRIYRYYETESTIYLLLQHASGGRLWAYAAAHSRSLAGLQSARPRLASGKGSGEDNVYSGRRCSSVGVGQPGGRTEEQDDGALPEREDEECSQAYLDLLYNTSHHRETAADRSPNGEGGEAEDGSDRLPATAATAAGSQHPLSSLSRSTSDPFSAKAGGLSSIASHSLGSAVTGTPARRWSVTSDELGLPPPPTVALHRPASAGRHRGGSGGSASVPENCVRQWAAEIAAALVHLHSVGVVCRDLRPDNVLLGEGGHVLLTFFGKWSGVRSVVHSDALKDLYAAPELQRPLTPGASIPATCDWWSFGALLYELLVGRSLHSVHPDGIGTHTALSLPAHLSAEARDLLTQLIRHCPSDRLGCGPSGEEDIMSHPFFRDVDWSVMCNSSSHDS